MKIEIDDALITRLHEAERRCDGAFGAMAQERAAEVLGQVVDQIVRDVVAAIRAMGVKEQS
jgi:hypothetical protein